MHGKLTESAYRAGVVMANRFNSLSAFLTNGRDHLSVGPVALILVEDEVEIASTVRHHLDEGFKSVICFGSPEIDWPETLPPAVVRVDHAMWQANALSDVINGCIGAARAGVWLFYCYNAEYLFYPFCEHRTVGEMLTFCTEERRESVLTYVIDLYAADLDRSPSAVSLEDAHLDKSGYYSLARVLPDDSHAERQLDFFGGLRWRFEEHIPAASRRIDRISLFRAKQSLTFNVDHTFSEAEYNTYACPWHNNLTAALCSFRTAKALKRNPGSTFDIHTFSWHKTGKFDWHSQQLLELGLIEPGQWF